MSDSPKLYHVTQHRPDSISHSITCQFTPNIESLVVIRGSYLEIFEIDDSDDSLTLLLRYNCFSVLRGIACLRNSSTSSGDSLILCSQSSGNKPVITQLTFDRSRKRLIKLHRYNSPLDLDKLSPSLLNSEYLAVDPYGRAVFVASLEAIRCVHAVKDQNSPVRDDNDNDDDDDGFIEDSPKHTIGGNADITTLNHVATDTFIYELDAVDMGEEAGPSFATIERLKYGEKQLVLYESNFGLNHINKLWSIQVSESCHNLICLPQIQDKTNGGRAEGGLVVFDGNMAMFVSIAGHIMAKHVIDSDSDSDPIYLAKMISANRNDPFIFIQKRSGRCIVVRFVDGAFVESPVEGSGITRHLDTIHILRNGYVMLVSQANHVIKLLQISELSSSRLVLDEVTSYPLISPVTSSLINRNKSMLIGMCSTSGSGISRLMFGREVEELAATPLPLEPASIFTAKYRFSNEYDDLILLSFVNNTTTVLAVGEGGSVEEISEAKTGLASTVMTTNTKGMMSGLVQIHSRGLRYVTAGSNGPNVIPWLISTRGTSVVASDISATQVALALSDMTIVYFKEQNGALLESQRRLQLKARIKDVAFSCEPHQSLHSAKLFVSLDDDTVREFTIEDFKQIRIHNVQFSVFSLLSTDFGLFIGHHNGTVSLIRDEDITVCVLGSNPVSLTLLPNQDVIALTRPRAWIFPAKKNTALQLCNCEGINSASSFVTEDVDSLGLVGISDANLLVLQVSPDTLSTGVSLSDLEAPEDTQQTENNSVTLGFLRTGISPSTLAFQKSQVSAIDAGSENTSGILHVDGKINAAISCRFDEGEHIDYITISCDKKLQVYSHDKGTYNLVHETLLDGVCTAMLAFKGKILAAIRNRLILFSLGQKQLLFKDEIILENCTVIRALRSMKNLVYVGDSRTSVSIISHSESRGFTLVGIDPVSRAVSSMLLLDFATVCIGNHNGEIMILRFPNLEVLSDLSNKEGAALSSLNDSHPFKLELVSHFWVNDAIVQLQLAMLSPTAASEAIIYTGLQGTIGLLIPFVSPTDYESYAEIEDTLNGVEGLVLDETISSFRNIYTPRRNVIDGDFCEHALQNATDKSLEMCLESLELTVNGLKNKLASIRSRC